MQIFRNLKPKVVARRVGFGLVNMWLVFHCLAIFLPPASVEPSAGISREAFWHLRFYPQLLFMDHGYHFFSPDPGDSTLVRFVARTENGDPIRGRFPDKRVWPRLLYHRYFMLSESVPRFADFDAEVFSLQARTYAQAISKKYGAQHVELYRVTHRMTDSVSFSAGRRLGDPESYDEVKIGDYAWPERSAVSLKR